MPNLLASPKHLVCRAVIAALLTVGCAFGQSQQPPQAPKVEAKQQPERPKENQVSAERPVQDPKSSVATNSDNANPGPNAKHGEEEGSEFWPTFLGKRVKISDSLLVLFTFVLAIATAGLWRSTGKLQREAAIASGIATKAAEAAGKTAELTRKAFIAANRPFLVVREVRLATTRGDNGITAVNGIDYVVANKGATKSTIVEGRVTAIAHWDEDGRLPIVPPHDEAGSVGAGLEIESGGFCQLEYVDPKQILGEFFLNTETRVQTSHNILFFGYFVYEDDAGTLRRMAFARMYDARERRFIAIDHSDYEYQD